MKANKAVKLFGNKLIGLKIRTEEYSLWPGGVAKVLELFPAGTLKYRQKNGRPEGSPAWITPHLLFSDFCISFKDGRRA